LEPPDWQPVPVQVPGRAAVPLASASETFRLALPGPELGLSVALKELSDADSRLEAAKEVSIWTDLRTHPAEADGFFVRFVPDAPKHRQWFYRSMDEP
jgi:hypothetical protein